MDLSTLNPAQNRAVLEVQGPILVIAGAGSGKTRVLTHRIAHLIEEHDVFPSAIMAITFTNKAANEMKTRIESLIGPVTSQMWVGTFHSICVRILRRDASLIGYNSDFVIYDTTDQRALLKTIYKELNVDDKRFPLKQFQFKISGAKNDMMSPTDYEKAFGSDFQEKTFIKVYHKYQEKIKLNQAMDFDDLLLNAIKLFKENPDALHYYQKRFRFIHVDEYQDTNRAQYTLIRMLSAGHRNLFVVGDGDQSIYKWRGADIRNIREFEEDFQGAQIIKLEQNYRSSKNILDLANSVIKNNPHRRDKVLWTDREPGEKIGYYQAYDERDEAQFIIRRIQKLIREENRSYGDFAILYRTNAQSRALEDALVLESMSYKVVGGLKFYERKEIKDILAYMKLVVNGSDDISFLRVINEPKRSIGDKTIEKMQVFANEHELSLLDAAFRVDEIEGVSAKAKNGIVHFASIISAMKEKIDTASVSEIFDDLLRESNILETYEKENTIEADGRIDNLYEFKSVIEEFQKRNESPNLRDFLAETSLRSDQDNINAEEEGVLLMTLHASKGLEFPVVFLVGLEDNLFPSFRAKDDPEELEEERRLCYVGITRAEDRLYVTHAKNRTQYGRFEARMPSEFLKEMDENLLENQGDRSLKELIKHAEKETKNESFFAIKPKSKTRSFMSDAIKHPQTQKPESEKIGTKPLSAGVKVKHKIFGEGLIISASNDGMSVTVAFDTAGIKKLDPAVANLKVIS